VTTKPSSWRLGSVYLPSASALSSPEAGWEPQRPRSWPPTRRRWPRSPSPSHLGSRP